MRKTITLEKKQLIKQFTKDFLTEIESETIKKVKKVTVNSLLNFSKSLKIVPSNSIKELNFEMIIN